MLSRCDLSREGLRIACMGPSLSSDKRMIVDDLSSQLQILRSYSIAPVAEQTICNAAGGPVNEPRIPWVMRKNPRMFSACQEFAQQVWIRNPTRQAKSAGRARQHIDCVYTLWYCLGIFRVVAIILGSPQGFLSRIQETGYRWFANFPWMPTELDVDWEWRSPSKVLILWTVFHMPIHWCENPHDRWPLPLANLGATLLLMHELV